MNGILKSLQNVLFGPSIRKTVEPKWPSAKEVIEGSRSAEDGWTQEPDGTWVQMCKFGIMSGEFNTMIGCPVMTTGTDIKFYLVQEDDGEMNAG
tara:strand:+ start:404 stop:685 length:282 start_codon:yes stop_codon:yes gene_type:complete